MSPQVVLDGYELHDVIGIGSVGTVYSGIYLETGDRVAVKRLHESVAKNEMVRERFKREIGIMSRLHHPNIVGYVGGKTVGKDLYYAMELVAGGSAKQIIETGGPLPWQATVAVGIQVCSALQFAHNHGVVHRDLKPSNLFLSTDGIVKLGDFGIARDLNQRDIGAKGVTVGTHAYMAPEQIRGEAGISGQADLYALGCCLFELMTGRQVFYGENRVQLFEQHLKAKPTRASEFGIELPEALDDLIMQLLSKSPSDRPFNARQAQATLLRCAEESHIREYGQEVLRERIEKFMLGALEPEVGWKKLLLLVIALIVFVAIAAFASK